MNQFDFHKNNADKSIHTHTHTQYILPIIQRFISAYKLWDGFRDHFPKKSRFTLGAKIDSLFLETIESLFIASRLSCQQKLPYLNKASVKFDSLKLFTQIAWELKALDNKKYIPLSAELNEIGRMLGGWKKGILIKENSAQSGAK